MKRKIKIFLLFIMTLTVLVLAGYFLFAFYYRDGFSLNTWINGVYCTGRTVEDVNSELMAQTEAPIITITDFKGEQYSIDLSKTDFYVDYQTPLNQYLGDQNPYLWVDNITVHREHTLIPTVSYDEDMLQGLWEKMSFIKEEKQKDNLLEIRHSKEGYTLYNGLVNRLDTDKAYQILKECIANGETELNLYESQCYFDMDLSSEQEQIYALWQRIDAFQSNEIIYDMGDENIELGKSTLSEFLTVDGETVFLDETGNLVLDEEKVIAFVDALAGEYDTYGGERSFLSTRGDVVTVKGGNYGTKLDKKAEVNYLMENLLNGGQQIRIPEYEEVGLVRGKNDIGTTYIEIDMTEQKMYYYEEGELLIETDVVTGNTGRRMGTPEGTYFVYNKQKNRILRGPGYASPVKFWVPVKGSIGIHDASWRSKFGGEIYKTNGSHGCINTPTEVMTELYDLVEIGTPVIIFY